MLHPHEQYHQAGFGRARMRRIGADQAAGRELATKSRTARPASFMPATPYTFDGYWRLPEKTRAAFSGEYCTVGDMARRDEEGYIHLVDRKSNMIISGGENIYPSEVEAVIGAHPLVKDVAVVGLPDEKWGERVQAAVVLHEGAARYRSANCLTGARNDWPASSARAPIRSCRRMKCRAMPSVKSCIARSKPSCCRERDPDLAHRFDYDRFDPRCKLSDNRRERSR